MKDHGTKIVAMEATGVYWIVPLDFLEEQGFEVKLLNPRAVKNVPGGKSDVMDCQWLQKLTACGLAARCFAPTKEFLTLRGYRGQRHNIVTRQATAANHMDKHRRLMNLNLNNAVTDITGVAGMTIIDSILAGEREPPALGMIRDKRCVKTFVQIAICLDGIYTEDNLY